MQILDCLDHMHGLWERQHDFRVLVYANLQHVLQRMHAYMHVLQFAFLDA